MQMHCGKRQHADGGGGGSSHSERAGEVQGSSHVPSNLVITAPRYEGVLLPYRGGPGPGCYNSEASSFPALGLMG